MRTLLAVLLITAATGAPADQPQRLALVVGNGAYANAPLRNPVNDARAISDVLGELGFRVIYEENADRRTLRGAIRKFGTELRDGGVGLFYFAGHGMQVDGLNYLIPIGADIQAEFEVPDYGLDAGSILRSMEAAGNALNIVILDACRNNPFARSFRSSSRGLARMDAPTGSIIAYATAPGQVAADGDGEHGVYTEQLLEAIALPGVPIEQVFKRVRVGVQQQTAGKQVPWEESSLVSNFFFVADSDAADPNATLALPSATALTAPGSATLTATLTPTLAEPVAVTVQIDQTSIVPVCHAPIDILRGGLRGANCDVEMVLEIDGKQLAQFDAVYTKELPEPVWTGELAPGAHDVTLKIDYLRKSPGLVDREVSRSVFIDADGTLVLKVHHDSVVIEERGWPFGDKRGMTPEVAASFERR